MLSGQALTSIAAALVDMPAFQSVPPSACLCIALALAEPSRPVTQTVLHFMPMPDKLYPSS